MEGEVFYGLAVIEGIGLRLAFHHGPWTRRLLIPYHGNQKMEASSYGSLLGTVWNN